MSSSHDTDTRDAPSALATFDGMIGQSAPMTNVFRRIVRVATLDEPVLILGETGTGKELVARSIHARSRRARGPLIAVNCSAVPTTLFESEFFGHERGAFTDAREARPGHFERAQGGTLFLDEIGDLPLDAQAKLLRVLDQREVQRLGGRGPVPIDVRVVATTNVDLLGSVNHGRFRKDLYWRLNKVALLVPSVRERMEDVILLVDAFFRRLRVDLRRPGLELSPAARQALLAHDWPGNVREIEHVVHHAILTAQDPVVEPSDLDLGWSGAHTDDRMADVPLRGGMTLHQRIAEACSRLERRWIRRALVDANGNQTEAARRLGIDPRTLYAKMRRYGIRC